MSKDKDNQKQGAEGGKPEGKPHGEAKPEARAGGKDGAPKGRPDQGKGGKGGPAKGGAHKGPKLDSPQAIEAMKPSGPPRLKTLFDEKIRGAVAEKFGIKNPMAQPRLQKITLNVNMGRHLEGTKIPPNVRGTVIDTITKVSGQKPIVQKSRKSVANFKLRAGMEASAVVTMRRARMWHFLDRLINLATPRIKDFRGLNRNAFDRQGNYSIGLAEQGVFPEINMAEVTFTHGMHVNFTFANSNPDLSRFVLEQMGMPFAKPEENKPEKKQAPRPPQASEPAGKAAEPAAAAPAKPEAKPAAKPEKK
jgi:large subunit ribosomal protein L5